MLRGHTCSLYWTVHVYTKGLSGRLGPGRYSESKERVIKEFQRKWWCGQLSVLESSLAEVRQETTWDRITIEQAEGNALHWNSVSTCVCARVCDKEREEYVPSFLGKCTAEQD